METKNIVDGKTLSNFLECSLSELRKLEHEASKTDLDFKRGRGKYDFIAATKFVIKKYKEEAANKYIVNVKDVAYLLGYNEKYINELEIKYGLPKDGFNQYDLFKVIPWFIRYYKGLHENKELEKQTIRLKTAQAEKFELENKRENEILIEREVMIDILGQVFSNIKNKIVGYPNKIAYQVFGSNSLTDAKVKTKKILYDVLNEIADPETFLKRRNNKT